MNEDGAMDFGEFANWFRRISTSINKFESKPSAIEAHRAATGQGRDSCASSVSGKGAISQFSGKGSSQKGGAALSQFPAYYSSGGGKGQAKSGEWMVRHCLYAAVFACSVYITVASALHCSCP